MWWLKTSRLSQCLRAQVLILPLPYCRTCSKSPDLSFIFCKMWVTAFALFPSQNCEKLMSTEYFIHYKQLARRELVLLSPDISVYPTATPKTPAHSRDQESTDAEYNCPRWRARTPGCWVWKHPHTQHWALIPWRPECHTRGCSTYQERWPMGSQQTPRRESSQVRDTSCTDTFQFPLEYQH